jgi:carbon monoxide dehydrogenase subunit G
MQFAHAFSVAAPIDDVWATITDIERVAPCVPNTRVTGQAGPESFDVLITATFGPFEITATGTITQTERDHANYREVLTVIVNDPDDEPLAEGTVAIVLSAEGVTTSAAVNTNVVPGAIATLLAEETLDQVAANTLRTFAANLEALLHGAGP